jgi:uncharacterized protein with von Willebrand factor type A (vWA) domain
MTATALARDRLLGFMRSLEETGVPVSTPKQADFLMSLVVSPPPDVDGLYWRARLTLLTGVESFAPFDAVFDAWFRGGRLLVREEVPAAPDDDGRTDAPRSSGDGGLDALEPREGT